MVVGSLGGWVDEQARSGEVPFLGLEVRPPPFRPGLGVVRHSLGRTGSASSRRDPGDETVRPLLPLNRGVRRLSGPAPVLVTTFVGICPALLHYPILKSSESSTSGLLLISYERSPSAS